MSLDLECGQLDDAGRKRFVHMVGANPGLAPEGGVSNGRLKRRIKKEKRK